MAFPSSLIALLTLSLSLFLASFALYNFERSVFSWLSPALYDLYSPFIFLSVCLHRIFRMALNTTCMIMTLHLNLYLDSSDILIFFPSSPLYLFLSRWFHNLPTCLIKSEPKIHILFLFLRHSL